MNCKKATYLLSKKEEGRLSWIEKWKLRGHLAICHLCRKFEDQTALIIRHAKRADEQIEARLPAESKKRIQALLDA